MNDRKILQKLASRLFGNATSSVNGQWNEANLIEKNCLLRMVMDVIEFKNVPESWDQNYMKTNLLLAGYFCITDTDVGVIPLRCGITGHNVWDQPNTIIIANDILGEFERKINVDSALIKLQYNYQGIEPILDLYAYMLSSCDASLSVNLMNTRVTFIAETDNKAQEKAMQKMYEDMSYGKPAIFMRNGAKSDYFFTNPKQSYIADEIQILKKNIKNEFKSLFGIYSSNQEKRERLISDEIIQGNDDVRYNIGHFIDNINHGFEMANALYNLNLKCVRKEYNINGYDSIQSTGMEQSDNG